MRERNCVNCTTTFLSTGPGNVVCLDCKSTFAGETWGPTKKDAAVEKREMEEFLRATVADLPLDFENATNAAGDPIGYEP